MAYLPHGTTVSIGGTLIGGLIAVNVPDRSKGEAETTDSDSAGDRRYIPALREGGSVELTFRHDPDDAGQTALETNYDADNTVDEIIITLPASATAASGSRTYTFDGFVTSPPSGEMDLIGDEAAQQSSTLKVAGPVTIA